MTAFINVIYIGGKSETLNNLSMDAAEAKFISLKSSGDADVLELWRNGDPSEHDLDKRYSKMLRAWDSVEGDLDVSQFCRKPIFMNPLDMFDACQNFSL